MTLPRAPNERVETAKALFEQGLKMVDIANTLGIPEGTIRSWKNRYKWNATLQKNKCNVAKQKGGQPGNKNATGPPKNKNAEKHGLFTKYLPQETLDIVNSMSLNPLDILWDQIQIAYAAIIRAQQIMYVKDKGDRTTTKIGESFGDVSSSERWEVQQAWDKQASFLKAQSQAMRTLQNLIKQYEDMLKSDMATEEQRARIDKIKAEIQHINGEADEIEDLEDIDGAIYGKN
ncbi:MAG: phage terminase small subunit [Eubacterium sp.]